MNIKTSTMDEKQLDLNAPLLSVRRLSTSNSKPASPNSGRKPEHVPKPAAIPFIWEQIPGQAKHSKTASFRIIPTTTTQTQTQNIDDQSSEDLQTDPFDTLSISFSYHSSETNSETESITPFGSDNQTRDYLMSRFLPAAKSMVIQTPQYGSKKQEHTFPDPPKYERKVYSGELRPMLLEKYPVNVRNNVNDENSVVVDGCKKKKKGLGFGFGLFVSRICTKRYSWLVSSVVPGSGTKVKVEQGQSPVAGPVPRLLRRSSYSGPLIPSLEKQAMDAVIKQRAESRSKEVNKTRRNPNPLTRSSNSLPSSPRRGLSRSGRISPYRNESPRSPFHDGARFLGVPKDVRNKVVQPKPCPSLNVKCHFSPRLIHDSPLVAPAKTLYIYSNGKSTNEAKIEANDGVDGSVRVPPLPKSPSESWLSRKMSLRSPISKKVQQVTTEQVGPSWETIVKTSNVHHDQARYSEELLKVSKYTEVSF